jgi:hypothetical protein
MALVLAVGVDGALGTVPGQNGKIAFDVGDVLPSWGSVYTIDPGGTDLTRLTPTDGSQERTPAWSPDGTQLVVSSRPGSAGEARLWVENADGTGRHQLTFDDGGPFHNDVEAAWSPDGSKIAYVKNFRNSNPPCSELYEVNVDGTGLHPLAPAPRCHEEGLVFSPDGTKIAYTSWDDTEQPSVWIADADDTNPVRFVAGRDPSWAPTGTWIAYVGPVVDQMFIDTPGVAPRLIGNGLNPEWSPDGRLIASGNGIATRDTAGGNETVVYAAGGDHPAWQPLPPPPPPAPGYPRPRGATPLVVPLVPAFTECTDAPNSTHGAPFSYGSCSPPSQASSFLTVGTPDANGQQANSVGSFRMDVVSGPDVALSASITDVRCAQPSVCATPVPLAPYVGSLDVVAEVQLTDRDDAGTGSDPATTDPTGYPFHLIVPCAATADPSTGAACSAATTANTLVPGLAKNGKRAIWELGVVQVWDGGSDGDPSTVTDNTLFADQGVFVP